MRTFLSVLALTFVCTGAAAAQAEQWWKHVTVLAHDSLEGRDTGTEGYRKAADYVAKHFAEAGLKPGGVNGWFQPVEFRSQRIDESRSTLELVRNGKAEPLVLGTDAAFNLRIAAWPEMVEAPLAFVGYGVSLPEAGYDDFAGVDLRGKVAVVLGGAPNGVPAALLAHARSSWARWQTLKKAGAIGLVSIPNPRSTDYPWERLAAARLNPQFLFRDSALNDSPGQRVGVTLNAAAADRLLEGSGYRLDDLLALADSGKQLPRFAIPASIRSRMVVDARDVTAANVVGVLPGTDPTLKNEYVVISAHLDHVGVGKPVNGDSIYNGAMDNASGIASLLETARAIGRQGGLKRSLVFAAVTAEEKGLMGARYFAVHPTVPRDRIVANLNTDMFMFIQPLTMVVGLGADESDLGDDLRAVAAKHKVKVVPDPAPEQNSFVRSDQYSFIREGIPALKLSNGYRKGTPEAAKVEAWLRDRYHAPSDDLEQPVDRGSAEAYNRLYVELVRRVADRSSRPQWRQESFFRRFAQAATP